MDLGIDFASPSLSAGAEPMGSIENAVVSDVNTDALGSSSGDRDWREIGISMEIAASPTGRIAR